MFSLTHTTADFI